MSSPSLSLSRSYLLEKFSLFLVDFYFFRIISLTTTTMNDAIYIYVT